MQMLACNIHTEKNNMRLFKELIVLITNNLDIEMIAYK